jgi:hypothetical protein
LAVRRDRKLRAAVLARRSCLGSLSRPERLVLTLRAGVGADAPRSRGTVAQRLRITVRRVTRLERAGLKRLRAVCGAATTSVAATTGSAATTDSAAPPAPGSTLAEVPPAPKSKTSKPARGATPAPSTEAEGPARGGVAGRSATNIPAPAEGGFPFWIPLLFLACGAGGYLTSRLLPARAGAAAAPASEAHWSTPPAGGVEPPPAPAPALPAHKPPVDDPPPKLPSHRSPSRHRH